MPVAKIQVQYGGLEQLINTFLGEANNAEQLYQKLVNIVGTLRAGGWTGRGAEAFYAEMDDLLPNLKRAADALQEASSALKKIGSVFQDAEQNAISGFKNSSVHPGGVNTPIGNILRGLMPSQLSPITPTPDTFLFGGNKAALTIQNHLNRISLSHIDSSLRLLRPNLAPTSVDADSLAAQIQTLMSEYNKEAQLGSNAINKSDDTPDDIAHKIG